MDARLVPEGRCSIHRLASIGGSGGALYRWYSQILNFPICAILFSLYPHIWGTAETGTYLGGQMGDNANTDKGECQ